jgi:hypothetical protein
VYLNVYVPRLQRERGVGAFFRFHCGHLFASSVLMDPISKGFVARLEGFAKQHRVSVVQFRKGERKDEVATNTSRSSTANKVSCSSAWPRRKPGSSERNGDATARPGRPIRG